MDLNKLIKKFLVDQDDFKERSVEKMAAQLSSSDIKDQEEALERLKNEAVKDIVNGDMRGEENIRVVIEVIAGAGQLFGLKTLASKLGINLDGEDEK